MRCLHVERPSPSVKCLTVYCMEYGVVLLESVRERQDSANFFKKKAMRFPWLGGGMYSVLCTEYVVTTVHTVEGGRARRTWPNEESQRGSWARYARDDWSRFHISSAHISNFRPRPTPIRSTVLYICTYSVQYVCIV